MATSEATSVVDIDRIIGPGHDSASVTERDQRDRLRLHPEVDLRHLGDRLRPGDGAADVDRQAGLRRHRHLGPQRPGGLGLRDHQPGLVDRHRPRRNPDLGDPAAAQPAVANLDQPIRRGDDAVRRGLRRDVSAAPHRASVAGRLLAAALPQHHGHVAELPQPADLGRVRHQHLRHRLGCSSGSPAWFPTSRPCATAPRTAFLRILYGVLSFGWRGSAKHWHNYEKAYLLLAGLSTPLVLSVHSVISFDFSVSVSCRAGTRRSSRPTSSPVPSSPASPWF